LIAATTSGSRAQTTVSWPERRITHASAVPKAPPPITPIRATLYPSCDASPFTSDEVTY
jgi:hypothetical protein